MRAIPTRVLTQSGLRVFVLVAHVRPAKTAEPIEMTFWRRLQRAQETVN